MNKLKDEAFGFIGVNITTREPAKLKELMEDENLNWRSFADDGSIRQQWGSPGTPTYFVIDPTGTIRHKWIGSPGAKRIETALRELLDSHGGIEK